MSEQSKKFFRDSEKIAFDKKHRETIKFNMTRYTAAVEKGKKQYNNLDSAKNNAAYLKHKVINNLDEYLVEFESNFTKNGGKVIWANDADEAVREILKILKNRNITQIVKSKSMVTEEIELNHFLEKNNIESLETDLGEFIVQIAGEKPYHIVTPAMHKSRFDIAELFHQKFNTPIDSSPEEITAFVREKLRSKYTQAGAGITGGNFLIAESGSVCLTENEGNGMLSMAFPKVHIAIVGIEKVIPSIKDLNIFWPLLATHGTGQNITVYNSIVNGPRKEGEKDGPDEMYVVLLDNGRSNLLAQKDQRIALSCIRCGACLNSCPVYKNIGGHTYNTPYSGPIGSVITPHLKGMKDFKHLSNASSLCGNCTEVCPVKIPLHDLLLLNRRDAVQNKLSPSSEKIGVNAYKMAMKNPWMIDFFSSGIKNMGAALMFKKAWGPRRDLPKIAPKSFREQWKLNNK
ncbi:MAG: iron-sulfur cluster-binding protein [Bacteroidales bacterium]|nr:iron-sulfur cluster-binding protein [Bacteroidales bacterium]